MYLPFRFISPLSSRFDNDLDTDGLGSDSTLDKSVTDLIYIVLLSSALVLK